MNGESQSRRSYSGRIILLTLLLSVGYAVLRYHIVGPVPWKDFPFFVLNKGFALAGFILLTLSFALDPLNNLGVRVSEGWINAQRALGMTGFLLVLIHGLMSFLLFTPAVYGKFFAEDGTLTLLAGWSMLGGVLAFVALWAFNLSFQTQLREDKTFIRVITSRQFLLAAMLLSAAHVVFMGFQGWLEPADWHGGLPPISLVSFAFFVGSFSVNLLGRE